MNSGIIDRIRGQRFYAGQIGRIDQMPAAGTGFDGGIDCDSSAKIIVENLPESVRFHAENLIIGLCRMKGLSVLYEHQQKAIAASMADKDVLLSTAEGSGRSTCIEIVAIAKALALSTNVLILCSMNVNVQHRLKACKAAVNRMGLGYVLRVSSITSYQNAGVPEIVVATPRQLMQSLETRPQLPLSFFACLSLVVAEDIHDYTGIYGMNAAASFRCLTVLTRRFGQNPVLIATAMPYANINSFASRLFNRDLSKDGAIISEDKAPSFKHPLIFWRAPMVQGEGGRVVYRRKDLVADIEQLTDFLSRDGIQNESRQRTFCFLIDKSISMEKKNKFTRVRNAVVDDIDRRKREGDFAPDDEIRIQFFDTHLGQPVFQGTADAWDEGSRASINKVACDGGTSISDAFRELVESLPAKSTKGRVVYVFMYSDGEDTVTASAARPVKKALAMASDKEIQVRICYVSLGIEPHISVRTLVEEADGVVVELPSNAEVQLPSQTLHEIEEAGRSVVVMSFSKAFATNDMNVSGSPLRPIVLIPEITHPELTELMPADIPSPEILRRAKYLVVIGWERSPALLFHFLRHAGAEDTTVFIIDIPTPASRLLTRRWHALASSRIPDRLVLDATHERVGYRALSALTAYASVVSLEETNYVLSRDENFIDFEQPSERLMNKSGLSRGEDGSVTVNENNDHRLPMFKAFHVAEKPLRIKTADGTAIEVDASFERYFLHPGAVCVINGRRFVVKNSTEEGSYQLVAADPGTGFWTEPLFDLSFSGPLLEKINESAHCGDNILLPDSTIHARAIRDDVVIRIRRNGFRRFERGRAGAYSGNLGKVTPDDDFEEINTTGMALIFSEGALSSEGVKTGLENLFWTFLPSLTRLDVPLYCVADSRKDIFYFGELASHSSGALDALQEDQYMLLSKALQYGAMILLACPCQSSKALEALNQAIKEGGKTEADLPRNLMQGPDDCGCEYCLRAASKPWGAPAESAQKYATLTFLGENQVISDSAWRQSLREKYENVDREDRIYRGNSPDEEGYLPAVLKIMADKVGAHIPERGVVPCRFMMSEEKEIHEGAGGMFCKDKVLVTECVEYAMLDLLSHEYGHNWEAVVCGGEYGWHERYNDENVEDPDNPLFRGKLYNEGAAVWLQSHVTDFFVNRDSIGENTLRSGNEYWEGFKLIKYVEEHYGLKAVLDMLMSEKLPGGTDIDKLLEDSGVNGSVQAEGRAAIDDGRLACLRKGYLDRLEHLVSHSAYFRAYQDPRNFPEIKDLNQKQREKVKQMLRPPNGIYSLRSLLDKVPGVHEYVEQHMPGCLAEPNSADMRLELACHLHSNNKTRRMDLWKPIIEIVEEYIDSISLPDEKNNKAKKRKIKNNMERW